MAAWYDKAVFYHIYPLGLSGAPKENDGTGQVNNLAAMEEWIFHIQKMGVTGLYVGPLFESVGHGYETTDYKMVDRRLGSNEDFKHFVTTCHESGIRVIVDGVFNHTGREFFAFRDLREKKEQSSYRDWYCNVNFGGNTEYNDGFSYGNWGGYNLMAKLNHKNPAVREYLYDVVRFWVSEFDVDGVRLDAADVLDFDFMKGLRRVTDGLKPEFWLLGEVIHGDYSRWANGEMLHSVTNYELHKGLYSGHNERNYFEIAHSMKRLLGLCGSTRLYNFADNHDVERIASRVKDKAFLIPIYTLLYTLPGIPSVYYGSEFGIEGKKERESDYSLRPALKLEDFKEECEAGELYALISRLGELKAEYQELTEGEYKELLLTNRQFAYGRIIGSHGVFVAVNNDEKEMELSVRLPFHASSGQDLLTGEIREIKDDVWKPLIRKAGSAVLYV